MKFVSLAALMLAGANASKSASELVSQALTQVDASSAAKLHLESAL